MRSFLSVTIIMVQYCKFSSVPLKKYMYKARGWRVTLLWQCFFPEIQKNIFLQNEFKTWTRFWFEWNLYLFKLGRYSHYVTFKIFYLHLWFFLKKTLSTLWGGFFHDLGIFLSLSPLFLYRLIKTGLISIVFEIFFHWTWFF